MVLYGNNAPRIDLLRPNAYRGCAAWRLFNMRAGKKGNKSYDFGKLLCAWEWWGDPLQKWSRTAQCNWVESNWGQTYKAG